MANYGGYGQSNPYGDSGNRYGDSYAQGGSSNYGQTSTPYPQDPPYPSRNDTSYSQPAPYAQQSSYGQTSAQQPGYAAGQQGYGAQSQGSRYNAPSAGREPATNMPSVSGRYNAAPAMGRIPPAGSNVSNTGNTMEMSAMNNQAGGYGATQASRDPNAILNECREIDRGIESIQKNLDRLRFLQERAINDPDASQGTATNRELDSLSAETMTLYRNFGSRIKAIKQQRESGEPRNRPQVGLVDRKLRQAINEYQQVERDFRHKLAAQMERQYRIVRPEASDAEVREAVEDTSNNQVFSQALMSSNRRGQSQSALRAVQGRHEAIQKIERQMVELAQLFQDMEAAVIEQEPAVMDIEQKGEDTVVNLGKGNEHLDKAVVKARSARKKKWICLGIGILILLIVAAIIAVVVWYFRSRR